MPINSYKMGPGTLELGAVPLDVSCQVTSLTVEPTEEVEEGESIDVLCGETLEDDDEVTYSYRLTGTLLQDLAAAGVVDWSWVNKGTEQDFTFIPNDVAARRVVGTVRPVPMSIGGDVKTRPTSDIDWAIIGEPVFEAVAP